jgi:N-acetylglucosaminyl-diphospho-decaprenol L-rhamnosyltransferase
MNPVKHEPAPDSLATEADPVPDCSILIVAFNSAAFIGDCLGSIAPAAQRSSYEVLLVDNGDGSTERLVAQQFPEVRIVPSQGNIGFAAGNNLLAGHARSDRLLLLNPDMKLFPGSLDLLLDGARTYPQAAAWGGVTCDAEGKPDIGNLLELPSLGVFLRFALGKGGPRQPAGDDLSTDMRVTVMIGGFVMFSRRAWDRAGGLDDAYFLYCEEVDLFFRLSRMGEHFWRIGNARGYHAIGHGEQMSERRLLYRTAGNVEFTRRHWGWARREAAVLLMWAGMVNRYLVGGLLGRWRPRLAAVSASYRQLALRPWLWRHGYDPQRGLLAQLDMTR